MIVAYKLQAETLQEENDSLKQRNARQVEIIKDLQTNKRKVEHKAWLYHISARKEILRLRWVLVAIKKLAVECDLSEIEEIAKEAIEEMNMEYKTSDESIAVELAAISLTDGDMSPMQIRIVEAIRKMLRRGYAFDDAAEVVRLDYFLRSAKKNDYMTAIAVAKKAFR